MTQAVARPRLVSIAWPIHGARAQRRSLGRGLGRELTTLRSPLSLGLKQATEDPA
jgi:hypothetical protein